MANTRHFWVALIDLIITFIVPGIRQHVVDNLEDEMMRFRKTYMVWLFYI